MPPPSSYTTVRTVPYTAVQVEADAHGLFPGDSFERYVLLNTTRQTGMVNFSGPGTTEREHYMVAMSDRQNWRIVVLGAVAGR